MNAIQNKSGLVEARHALDKRCVVMLMAGMSYKTIERDLGLTKSDISRIRKECGISAWEYRNGRGPLGKVVCRRIVFTPVENIDNLVKLFSDGTTKKLQ